MWCTMLHFRVFEGLEQSSNNVLDGGQVLMDYAKDSYGRNVELFNFGARFRTSTKLELSGGGNLGNNLCESSWPPVPALPCSSRSGTACQWMR